MLFLNHIKPEVEKILKKKKINKNSFQRNQSTTSQILTILQIIGISAKKKKKKKKKNNLEATLLLVDFSKAFDSIHRGKMKRILLVYGFHKKKLLQP